LEACAFWVWPGCSFLHLPIIFLKIKSCRNESGVYIICRLSQFIKIQWNTLAIFKANVIEESIHNKVHDLRRGSPHCHQHISASPRSKWW
jgi:hypothetical protein